MAAATNELRVTVLLLDGIRLPLILADNGCSANDVATSSVLQNTRISAWVGFRSSFPPESMSIPSSHYSSLFENQGNLLAVESEQVDTSKISNDSNDYSGVAYWINRVGNKQDLQQMCDYSENVTLSTPGNKFIPHLQIKLPPPAHETSTKSMEEIQSNSQKPPNVIEIHICVTSTSFDPMFRDNNDAEKENSSENPCYCGQRSRGGNENNATFGVAHLKVPHSDPYNQSSPESPDLGEIIRLPVTRCRTKSPNNLALLDLKKNATISIFVERVPTLDSTDFDENDGIFAKKYNSNNQRHYVKCGWPELNDRLNFAPPSIIHQENQSSGRMTCMNEKRVGGLSRNWLQSTPPRILPIMSELLEGQKSSKPSGNDEAKAPKPSHAIKEESLEEASENAVNQSIVTDSDSFPFQLEPEKRVQTVQVNDNGEDTDDAAKSKRSLSQRIHDKVICGTPLADIGEVLKTFAQAAQHCDEDHVDIYVQDSDSLGTSIATDNDIFGL